MIISTWNITFYTICNRLTDFYCLYFLELRLLEYWSKMICRQRQLPDTTLIVNSTSNIAHWALHHEGPLTAGKSTFTWLVNLYLCSEIWFYSEFRLKRMRQFLYASFRICRSAACEFTPLSLPDFSWVQAYETGLFSSF